MRSFDIPDHYQSNFISFINEVRNKKDRLKKDFTPSEFQFSNFDLLIARHFGFCFGVKNAVEKVYHIIEKYPDKDIYLISEIIHNPEVNEDLKSRGVKFIQETDGSQLIPWDNISEDDVIVIPAFGTSLETMHQINQKGISVLTVDTTCPFVEKVWNKGDQLAKEGYTIVIHGDFFHEETRATFSRISKIGKAVVISNLKEAKMLKDFMSKTADVRDWKTFFGWKTSPNFNFRTDLERIAVVNQTTMLAEETAKIADFLKEQVYEKNNKDVEVVRFAETRDTLCYATNDNQTAVKSLVQEKPDFAFVAGGQNSSNTTHLVEILEKECPTYFVRNESSIGLDKTIEHFDIHNKTILETSLVIAHKNKPKIAITAGASCPDYVLDGIIHKLASIYEVEDEINAVLQQFKGRYG